MRPKSPRRHSLSESKLADFQQFLEARNETRTRDPFLTMEVLTIRPNSDWFGLALTSQIQDEDIHPDRSFFGLTLPKCFHGFESV